MKANSTKNIFLSGIAVFCIVAAVKHYSISNNTKTNAADHSPSAAVMTAELKSKNMHQQEQEVLPTEKRLTLTQARDAALNKRLENQKLIQLVQVLGKSSMAGYKSGEAREKYLTLSKQLASHGKEAEDMVREAFSKLHQRDMTIARMALIEAALIGKMDQTLLSEMGEKELELSIGMENAEKAPIGVRQIRGRLISAATTAYLANDVSFSRSAQVLSSTLAKELDPLVRASVLKVYVTRYPNERETISRIVASVQREG